ncbi:hypothetical protein BX600DRAFT_455912 [Xylariales sp. PMI_506]|nr:hypothetical protein BX600DRAFT_455912 [Xylariales sp. PMI_506]
MNPCAREIEVPVSIPVWGNKCTSRKSDTIEGIIPSSINPKHMGCCCDLTDLTAIPPDQNTRSTRTSSHRPVVAKPGSIRNCRALEGRNFMP